eukprot:1007993-Pyramimonas_sp.AAC.1
MQGEIGEKLVHTYIGRLLLHSVLTVACRHASGTVYYAHVVFHNYATHFNPPSGFDIAFQHYAGRSF